MKEYCIFPRSTEQKSHLKIFCWFTITFKHTNIMNILVIYRWFTDCSISTISLCLCLETKDFWLLDFVPENQLYNVSDHGSILNKKHCLKKKIGKLSALRARATKISNISMITFSEKKKSTFSIVTYLFVSYGYQVLKVGSVVFHNKNLADFLKQVTNKYKCNRKATTKNTTNTCSS